jgi:O-antigen/teichoic acid export membrane protein
MRDTFRSWWQDGLLRGIIKNSSYLFTSNSAAIFLSMLQGIFAARLLGATNFGILAATVIPLVSNVHRLLSFRMSELVVKHTGQFLADGKKERVAALIKGALLTETTTSLLAYLILLLIAPLAATYLAKDPQTVPLFTIYGLVLLSNFAYETSLGVLQATNAFNRIAFVNLIQSVITASLILLAFIANRGIIEVMLAYLLGKSFAGVLMGMLALRRINHIVGRDWWRVSLRTITEWSEIGKFAISTNLNGTVNLIVRDSETLFITALRSPTEAGYFKIALGVINLVMLPIEPFIAPTYAEIARTIGQRNFGLTKRLLKRVSTISGSWTIMTGVFLAIFGSWVIPFMYGTEYSPAYPAMLILLVGYGFANTLHWNRPLLLAFGLPTYPLKVSGAIGIIKTALTFWLVPLFGYLIEAVILSLYFLSSITLIVLRGIRILNTKLQLAPDELGAL